MALSSTVELSEQLDRSTEAISRQTARQYPFEPQAPPCLWNRTTYLALASLVVLWCAKVYLTWAAWGNLSIDSGHEMYVPALLAEGKLLYRDAWFPFGPASAYFNSYLFRIFGVHLEVLYWAGSLAALGSALFLYFSGMRLSSWPAGWAAGTVLLLEAFHPSLFCFPLPYSFAAVYGCLVGCAFVWMVIHASGTSNRRWIFAAGSAAAVALLLKPEFGVACYAALTLLVIVRAVSRCSWSSVGRDALAILPGLVACAWVAHWMVSIGGFEFITQENIQSWPNSYLMRTYGKAWLEGNGLTLTLPAFWDALLRTAPIAGLAALLYGPAWSGKSSSRLLRFVLFGTVVLYVAMRTSFHGPVLEIGETIVATFAFPRDMVLYVGVAALMAWCLLLWKRDAIYGGNPAILLLSTYSSLAAFRVLMKTMPAEYPIYYNGPVVLAFLLLALRLVPRTHQSGWPVVWREGLICLACVLVAGLHAVRVEAVASRYVPLKTERGTIRAPANLATNYEAAIRFMKDKAARGESVLSIPEDTSLYFLSGTHCPTRAYFFIPGLLAPGKMTDDTIREIERQPVSYLLWSNRVFPEYGAPLFGKDFNPELGEYLRSHYERVGPLLPPVNLWEWSANVWKRKPTIPAL
jgi:hypothetical protein